MKALRRRWLGLGCLVATLASGCIAASDLPEEEVVEDVTQVLTDAVMFEGGTLIEAAIPGTTAEDIRINPLDSVAIIAPGETSIMGLNIDSPVEDSDPVVATLVRFGDSPHHVAVTRRTTRGEADVENSFTVADDACATLCRRSYSATLTEAFETEGGEIGDHHERSVTIDCTDAASRDCGDSGGGDGAGDGDGVDDPPDDPMGGSGNCASTGKLDLLLAVDNSGSMREEQDSLRQALPDMLQQLADGGATDVHLGVVSSDMGLVGIEGLPGCMGLGDDGIMLSNPSPEVPGCSASYPSFLSYMQGMDAVGVGGDLGCIATLGTDGCGFEQQLEAVLKALWPSSDAAVQFLPDVGGSGRSGHGDQANQGFLRNDSATGESVIAVVMLTDEEDCSSSNTVHFTPPANLTPGDPLESQDLNLRCFFNPQNLYAIDRYVNGLRALRPGGEQRVLFAAIAGVPLDLVPDPGPTGAERDAWFDQMLTDQRMQEVPDPNLGPGQGNLTPSCDTEAGRAFPPRRLVEVARSFGDNGIVQSICQSDLSAPIQSITDLILDRMADPCGRQ